MEALEIQMLGGFSIKAGEKTISDRDNRSRKLWNLLAYLIYHRHRLVMQEELMEILWSEGRQGSNPAGALKTALHRVRIMLNTLWPTAGHDLILCRNNGYVWNNDIPAKMDFVMFEKLCKKSNEEMDARQCFETLKLYQGDFLPHMSSESWVIPIAAYFHNCYVQSLLQILEAFMAQERYHEVAELCRAAIVVEPFHEGIHCYLMQALLQLGDQRGAVHIYKQFGERLHSDFGIFPGEDIRALYYEAMKNNQEQPLTTEELQRRLAEADDSRGAFLCDYDFFRVLYQFMMRYMVRSGIEVQGALFDVVMDVAEENSQRKLQGWMKKLEEQLCVGLRRGDTVAQCSASQYIVMLPQTDSENGSRVCERVIKAFYRKHPHSDAVIRYEMFTVQPGVWNKEVI